MHHLKFLIDAPLQKVARAVDANAQDAIPLFVPADFLLSSMISNLTSFATIFFDLFVLSVVVLTSWLSDFVNVFFLVFFWVDYTYCLYYF